MDPYDHANAIFADALKADGRSGLAVLDVGCWNGALGRKLKAQLNVVIDGIERDASQAASARENGYRNVHVLDLNRQSIKVVNCRYDYVLFGDVLEHLLEPDAVLRESRTLLAEGGKTLVSMPNIAFLGCRLSHLLGKWDYADYGILDRTHLRFYTRGTMLALMEDCGFRVEWLHGYVGLSGYPWYVRRPLRWLGRVWPTLFAIQIVLCGTPRPSD